MWTGSGKTNLNLGIETVLLNFFDYIVVVGMLLLAVDGFVSVFDNVVSVFEVVV